MPQPSARVRVCCKTQGKQVPRLIYSLNFSGHSQMTLLISQAHSFSIISVPGLEHRTMTIQSI